MKRIALITLSIASLCILMSTPFANATKAGYGLTNYQATEPTTNGTNTTGEWNDADIPTNLPTNFVFREKWTWPSSQIYEHILIEFFTDNTNDTGDYYQICWDNNANGGSKPQTDDVRIEWKGHSSTGFKVYQGNGAGWTQYTGAGATLGTEVVIAESLSSSPLNSTPHWVVEMKVYRSGIFDVSGSTYAPGINVAVYDASNSAAGIQSWPPGSVDIPSDWGLETGSTEAPESLTIVIVITLSSVAIIASVVFLRKQPIRGSKVLGNNITV